MRSSIVPVLIVLALCGAFCALVPADPAPFMPTPPADTRVSRAHLDALEEYTDALGELVVLMEAKAPQAQINTAKDKVTDAKAKKAGKKPK